MVFTQQLRAALVVGALVFLLQGCAAGAGGPVATLPPPPETIAPFDGARHATALADPKLLAAMARDTSHDSAGAVAAYRLAADAGNPIAQYMLGMAYFAGDGVARDDVAATQYFHMAAVAGYAPAQSYLGDRYQRGAGVARDQTLANRWYRFAAAQGEDSAASRLALQMIQGDGMAQDVPGALALLHACAAPTGGVDHYYPSGREGGPGCQAFLGAIYLEGDGGVPRDISQGIHWMTRAAERHMPRAESELAKRYESGEGEPRDSDKAAFWRNRASADADIQPGNWTEL